MPRRSKKNRCTALVKWQLWPENHICGWCEVPIGFGPWVAFGMCLLHERCEIEYFEYSAAMKAANNIAKSLQVFGIQSLSVSSKSKPMNVQKASQFIMSLGLPCPFYTTIRGLIYDVSLIRWYGSHTWAPIIATETWIENPDWNPLTNTP